MLDLRLLVALAEKTHPHLKFGPIIVGLAHCSLRADQEPMPNCPGFRLGQFGAGCWSVCWALTTKIVTKPDRIYSLVSSQ